MKILGIETSCDETAIAVIEARKSKNKKQSEEIKILSNIVSSQIKLHTKFGGVVPNLAAREHVKNIRPVFKLALRQAEIIDFQKEVDLIAVTRGPGLSPALLVGIAFAKTLAWKYNKPIIGVNHLEGHIYSNWLPSALNFEQAQILNTKNLSLKTFPILNLIVSGGHTELVFMRDHGKYEIIGETMDDAVGEAFDKVARLLDLGYPGGPAISKHALKWKAEILNPKRETNIKLKISFPQPMEKSKDYNFSYSGLKTAVLYKIKNLEKTGIPLSPSIVNKICHEFQKAALEVLIKKTIKAAKEYRIKSIFLSGGVSANKYLRTNLEKETKNIGLNYAQPELEYTGDNAAMIALTGYFNFKNKKDSSWESVEMNANLRFN